VPAARGPICGAERGAHLSSAFARRRAPPVVTETVLLNGMQGIRVDIDGALTAAISFVVEDGRISHIYAVNNPHKLARLGTETLLTR